MSEITSLITPVDRTLFSLHEEDEMTERRFHAKQAGYFDHAFTTVLPDLFVAVNMAVYWVPGQCEHPYVGPDVFVSRHHPQDDDPSCYLTYEDGPITFVVEVASEKTRANEPKKRDETYGAVLRIPEYLYVDRDRDVLELWRLVEGLYQLVAADEQGRLWSQELGIGFFWQEDHRLVRVVTADGAVVPTSEEEAGLRRAAEASAQREARRSEEETRRAAQAAQRAEAAERRAASMSEEIERLRRALEERGGA